MKQRMRRISALLLVLLMCVSLVIPAFAADESASCPGKDGIHKKSNCSYSGPINVHEAGCGKQGYTVYQCDECDTYFADDFVESFGDHDWMYLYKDATCTEPGYYKEVCYNCGIENVNTVQNPLGHEWNGIACDDVVCNRCGIAGVADDDDHNWGEPVLNKAPTHTSSGTTAGKATLTCEDCGLKKEVAVECTTEHVPVVHAEIPATCQKEGRKAYTDCSICGAVISGKNEAIAKIPCEAKTEWTIEAPTCITPGTAYHECKMCGALMGMPVMLPTLGHGYEVKVLVEDANGKTLKEFAEIYNISTKYAYNSLPFYIGGTKEANRVVATLDSTDTTKYVWSGEVVMEGDYSFGANCYDQYSYIHYDCFICHETVTDTLTPGHVWEEVSRTEADCTVDGEVVYECVNPNCSGALKLVDGVLVTDTDVVVDGGVVYKTDVIKASGHNFVPTVTAPTCKDGGYTEDVCACGAKDTEKGQYNKTEADLDNGHKGEDVITLPADCLKNGKKDVVCAYCSKKLETNVVVPALGHNLDYANPIRTTPQTCDKAATTYYNCVNEGCTSNPIAVETGTPLGHSFSKLEVVAPNCLTGEDGYTVVYCNNGCGATTGEKLAIVPLDLTNPEHHRGIDEVSRVEGDCKTPDVVTYECRHCNDFTYTVNDTSKGNGKGHNYETHKAVAATCVTTGNKEYKVCKDCGFTTMDGETAATAADWTVPALRLDGQHGETKEIPAVAPTCTTKGNEAGAQCTVCGVMVDSADELPALNHEYRLISADVYKYNTRKAGCVDWGYDFHQCTRCGAEKIVNYVGDFGGHTEEEYDQVDPTCFTEGTAAGVKCTVCDENLSGGETLAKVAHKNNDEEPKEFYTFTGLDGEEYAKCTETVENLYCVYCEDTYEKACDWAITEVPATCCEYSYELWVCVNCEEEKMMNPGFTYAPDHIGWGDWVTKKEATTTEDGLKVRVCVCGMKEEVVIPAQHGIDFTIKVDNAIVPGAEITNSGLVSVVVETNAKALDVWGIRMTLKYDPTAMYFDEETSAQMNEAFEVLQFNDVLGADLKPVGLITVVAYASADKTENIVLDGPEALVQLNFRLSPDAELGDEFTFEKGDILEVVDKDNNYIKLELPEAATAEVEAILGYITEDDVITIHDSKALMTYITGEAEDDYCSAADIDLDGEITQLDLAWITGYLLGEISEDDLALAYIVPVEDAE